MITIRPPIPALFALSLLSMMAVVLLSAPAVQRARAQGVSVLSPMPPKYGIGGFEYVPPQGDGWRETSSSPVEFRIVYAEQVDTDKIKTRMEFWARAFDIEDPAQAPDGFRLALASLEQRKKEREDRLVASSNVELLAGTAGVFTYSLVTRVGDGEVFETFYSLLAPDKSAYMAAKFLSRDADYDEQPYYKPLMLSLPSFKPPAPAAGVPAPKEPSAADDSPTPQNEEHKAGAAE